MEHNYESLITEFSLELNRPLTTNELDFVQWLVDKINKQHEYAEE